MNEHLGEAVTGAGPTEALFLIVSDAALPDLEFLHDRYRSFLDQPLGGIIPVRATAQPRRANPPPPF